MKELKILALLIGLTLVTYIGIEPYAHQVMHPHLEGPDFEYLDLADIEGEGDVARGRELTAVNCTYCHSIKSDGVPQPVSKNELINKYGSEVASHLENKFELEQISNRYLSEMYTAAVPLDLSDVGNVFNEKFLKHFIKNPAYTAFESTFNLHKTNEMYRTMGHTKTKVQKDIIVEATQKEIDTFAQKNKIAMPAQEHLSDQDLNDIVVYLKSISHDVTPRHALEIACGRCHGVAYDNITPTTPTDILDKYLGMVPPDVSMMIRSKGEHYLTVFLNDPQKVLIGSSMPRVGINEATQEKIVHYLETVGDAKKEERESLGFWVLVYMTIFTVLAYLYKRKVFKEVH